MCLDAFIFEQFLVRTLFIKLIFFFLFHFFSLTVCPLVINTHSKRNIHVWAGSFENFTLVETSPILLCTVPVAYRANSILTATVKSNSQTTNTWSQFLHPKIMIYWPRGYKTFFMLNSVEHEIFPAHKC